MKILNKTQFENLKKFWDEEYEPLLSKIDSPVRVYFNHETFEWLTWEEDWHSHPELNNPEKYFYFDTGDEWMCIIDLCELAENYLNNGTVNTCYY